MLRGMLSGQHEACARLLESQSTFATVLHVIALHEFDSEFYQWEPETIFLEFKDTFDVEIPERNMNKLLSLAYGMTSNQFYRNYETFTATCYALNGRVDPFGVVDPLMPAEMAWALTEFKLNDSTPEKFSSEIASYVGHLLYEDGIESPPPIFKWVNMPSIYRGSDAPGDTNQQRVLEAEKIKVIYEYLHENGTALFQQISGLPWMTQEKIDSLEKAIRS